jgi:oligopeptide transport system substrate-binding protein
MAGLLVALGSALLLAAVSFSAATERPADVRILNLIEPETLDPQLVSGTNTDRIVSALFEGLTRHDARTLEPAPGMAESWDVSDDGLRYTFHLRADARWTDGTPLDASDFVYSWRRVLAPETGSRYAYMLHPVRGARAINTFDALARRLEVEARPGLLDALTRASGSALRADAWQALATRLALHDGLQGSPEPRVRGLLDGAPHEVPLAELQAVLDALAPEASRLRAAAAEARARFGVSLGVFAPEPHTLIVELEAPTPYFLELTSFHTAFPVPRAVVEAAGRSWFLPAHIVSNGPFVLEAWRVNDRIRLRKSPDYWGRGEVKAERIELYPVENATTALNLFLSGEADWLPNAYPTELAADLLRRSDFYTHPGLGVYFFRFNTLRPPLDDPRVRQAFNLAIDREVIVERVLGLGQPAALRVVPDGIPGYDAPPTGIGLDVERARQLLADAGFPGGRGFPKLGILYNTQDMHKKIAEVIADQLARQLGIQVQPYNQEWQSYMASVREGQYDLARGSWIGDYVDATTFLDLWVTGGGNNQTGFSSHTYDALIRAASNVGAFAEQASLERLAPPQFDSPQFDPPQSAPSRPLPPPAASTVPDRPPAEQRIDEQGSAQQFGGLLSRLKQPRLMDELLQRRAGATDPAERRQLLERVRSRLLTEAEAILVQDEFPVLPIYFYVNIGMKAPRLRGLYTEVELPGGARASNLLPLHPLRDLWVEPGRPE